MMATNTQIRDHLGHNGTSCRVRIQRDGEIHRYGSADPYDSSHDFWHFVGRRSEIEREMSEMSEETRPRGRPPKGREKFQSYLAPELREQLHAEAADEGVSPADLLERILERRYRAKSSRG